MVGAWWWPRHGPLARYHYYVFRPGQQNNQCQKVSVVRLLLWQMNEDERTGNSSSASGLDAVRRAATENNLVDPLNDWRGIRPQVPPHTKKNRPLTALLDILAHAIGAHLAAVTARRRELLPSAAHWHLHRWGLSFLICTPPIQCHVWSHPRQPSLFRPFFASKNSSSFVRIRPLPSAGE